jgi:uncharacterized membrane protein YesL
MGGFRTLWTALVSLYEDTLVLLVGNLAAVGLNVVPGLLLFAVGLVVLPGAESAGPEWLVALIAWLMPFFPTPGNVALAGLTSVAAGPDVPYFASFRDTLRARWRLAARCTLLSLAVFAALLWNIAFYLSVGTGWLPFVSILWLYATLFWLSVHLYLLPLMVHVREPRVLDLYRRAIFIALGHPAYTLLLLFALLVLGIAAVAFLPVYVLVGVAYMSLVQAHALREIRRRHGDLLPEPEEASRL